MNDLRKAAEMALEALEQTPTANKLFDESSYEAQKDAIEALRQALAQPEQEPVGYVTNSGESAWILKDVDLDDDTPLYTAPPKREWVGLTDGEIDLIFDKHFNRYAERGQAWPLYEREIEAKLKEKNT
jgi:uncharacterized UPF0160 family protein